MLNQFYSELKKDNGLKGFKISATIDERRVIYLSGEVREWQQVVDIGHIAGKLPGIKGVVNNIVSEDSPKIKAGKTKEINLGRARGIIADSDIVIIGAGITGAAIARTLSKYNLRIIVVEKCSDISEGASKANNGMIHPGHDPKHGTLKAKCNVIGNAMYDQWAKELNFKLTRPGQLLVALDEDEDERLLKIYENALRNGVPQVRLITKEEALQIEPKLGVSITSALWLPTAGFVHPYEVVEALMENAIDNGTKLMLETEVVDIEVEEQAVRRVVTNRGVINTKCVINAAGLYADNIAEMVGDRFYTIHPRKGTLIIFDKKKGEVSINANISTLPSQYSKGGGNMKTVSGNPLWGPSAREVPQKDDLSVEEKDLNSVLDKVLTTGITKKDIITFFSGLRAADYKEDFIIEPSEIVKGFIHVAGIQSPGLASAPAIAKMVEEIYLEQHPDTMENPKYNPIRPPKVCFRDLSRGEQDKLIRKNPKYGHIICRCETVTEGEIIDAIHGKIPALTLDAVKRRTRSGMGRCQGGFCGPRVIELLSRELCIPWTKVTKRGKGTEMLISENR
jgi:glycerol-3-phosphate dehydrogenase